MNENTAIDHECTDLEPRDVRALTECLTVLPEEGRARDAADLYTVVSQSGREYLVDTRTRVCECPDSQFSDGDCKHLRRVDFETGTRSLPPWADLSAVDEHFRLFVQPAIADGGSVADADDVPDGACPFGDPVCEGVSGLFFGHLSCWECYRLAPTNARDVHHVTTERARSGREHPALAGRA